MSTVSRSRRRSPSRRRRSSGACRSCAPGGAAVLWLGPSADLEAIARVSERVGGGPPEERDGLVVVPKLIPTPAGFPRRPGVAKKRPLV